MKRYATDKTIAYAIIDKNGKLVTDGIGKAKAQLQRVCDPDESVVKVSISIVEDEA